MVVGFLLFLLNIMGGGDSKYLASLFLIIPLQAQNQFLNFLLISTIFVGFMFFLRNVYKHRVMLIASLRLKDKQGVKSCFGTKFAYAPVILIAWIFLGVNYFTELKLY
jgi:prepilin peptidase CpaA